MYRYVDTLVVRAAACRPDEPWGEWPDVTGPAAGLASWRPWLRQVMAAPEFAEALRDASPVLADRVDALCDGSGFTDRAARRVVLSVMRYLLRAGGRATPYGLFAGVGPAHVAAAGIAQFGGAHRAVARIRAEWLATVIDRLEADRGLGPHLTVVVNNLALQRGDRVVVEHRASRSRGGAPMHVSVRAAGPLRAALAGAADPIRWHDLAGRLSAEFSVANGRIEELLAQLVAQRLLLTNLRPPMTTTDPLAHLVAELEAVVADAVVADAAGGDGLTATRQTIVALRRILDDTAGHDGSSTEAAGVQRGRIAAALSVVCPTPEPAVSVDLRLDCTVAVPPTVAREAARAAGLLVRLARPHTSGWPAWHRRFLERFGPHAVIPVLRAVDPDVGLGLPNGYLGAPPIQTPGLTDRDRRLLAIAQRAALKHQREILLDDATLAELAGGQPAASIQPTTELTVRVHAATMHALQRGEFRLAIVGVSRSAGTTTGRFLDLFESADRERISAQYAALPTATRGALRAQVSASTPYTAAEDVARAPLVMRNVVSIGEFHDNRNDGHIPLSDLAVTADEHRICLISVSRRDVVEPVVLNAIEPTRHTLPLVRFLTEAPTALSTLCAAFDWGAAAGLPFLPALRHGRTILSPARWVLSRSELPDHAASWAAWRRSLAVWLEAVGCPPTVYLGDGDQRISLDLAEPAHQALLRDDLGRRDVALLRAAPAPDSSGWIGGVAHEIVIPLGATVVPAPPPRLPQPLRVVDVREHGRLPGLDGRLYVKLYAHPDRQTTILTHHLPGLLDALHADDRWWFLRYGDPEPHLRLRLTGSAAAAAISSWTQHLRGAGLIARVQFDTDYPETARFGGPAALAAAEQHFAADSAAALAQLVATDCPGAPDVLALTAASLLDLVVAAVGGPAEAMRWLIDHTRPHRIAPARAVYDQAVLLANPHDHTALAALPGGERILSSWSERRRALTAYRDVLHTVAVPATRLLPDLLHLHHVRIAGPDPDSEHACLHLARAAALSWSTRVRSRP